MTDSEVPAECEVCKQVKITRCDVFKFWLGALILMSSIGLVVGAYVHANEQALRTTHCRYVGLAVYFPYETHLYEHLQAKGSEFQCTMIGLISSMYETTVKIVTLSNREWIKENLGLSQMALWTDATNRLELKRDEVLWMATRNNKQ